MCTLLCVLFAGSIFPLFFYNESRFCGRQREFELMESCFWNQQVTQNQTCRVQSFVLQVIKPPRMVWMFFVFYGISI